MTFWKTGREVDVAQFLYESIDHNLASWKEGKSREVFHPCSIQLMIIFCSNSSLTSKAQALLAPLVQVTRDESMVEGSLEQFQSTPELTRIKEYVVNLLIETNTNIHKATNQNLIAENE